MTAVLQPTVRPGPSYRHEAFFYSGDEEYVAGTVPLLRDGVDAGEAVMAALPPDRLAQVRTALAAEAPATVAGVRWVDLAELGRNPANILAVWSDFLADNGGRRARGIGEAVWPGRRQEEVQECQLLEALLNLAVSPDVPFWLRCPYDAQALDEQVLRAAHLSHPVLCGPGQLRGSTTYAGAHHAAELLSAELPEPDAGTDVLTLPFVGRDLPALRTAVQGQAAAAGLSADRADDLAHAVHESAANSIQHGGGRGVLRSWRDAQALVVEVRDEGRLSDPLVGRRTPSLRAEGGRGVYLVHRLCDLVRLRSGDSGTRVRMVMRVS